MLMASGSSFVATHDGTQVKMMRDGPIVEEMRVHGSSLPGMLGDIRRMCEPLRELEAVSGCNVVDREPKRPERRVGARAAQIGRAGFHAMHGSPTLRPDRWFAKHTDERAGRSCPIGEGYRLPAPVIF